MTAVEPGTFEHDLFIVHAEADGPFVRGHLLPAVGLPAERVLLSSRPSLGERRVAEIERGVRSSRLTIVVLSPAYLTDRWAEFGEQLASHASVVEGRLVPLLRADCEVPLWLDALVSLDFRDPATWAEEAQRLRTKLGQPEPTPADLPCPYLGMRAYSAETAAQFHGRDAEVDEILGRLRAGEREIYVIGPSGSGKSSLVAAGVLPRLASAVAGLGTFLVRSLRPGEHPSARLREALEIPEGSLATPGSAVEALLAPHPTDTSVLIVIDQLEELFALASTDERARFLTALRALRSRSRCVMIAMLRADFFGDFMECPLWADRRGRISRIEVSPLRGKALRAAIGRPARGVGVFFEPELFERLLADAAAEPGILPLLQETLVQLWERRRLRLVTLVDYQALGEGDRSGLAVALARRADATLRALTPAQESIAHRILLRLINFGEGRSETRRQQPRSKLRAADDNAADFDAVLQQLIGDRLLTTNGDEHGDARIDLAHEVMIVAWPTLTAWIQTYRADEQRRRQLEAAAALWATHGCGPGGLLDPIVLAEAQAWRKTESARNLGDSSDVSALIAASQAAHDEQVHETAAGRRRLQALAVGAGTGMILLLAMIARTTVSVASVQEQELQDGTLQTNAYAAHALAGAVAFHLREQVDAAMATAADPGVVRALRNVDGKALEQRRSGTPFDTIGLYDRSGAGVGQAPRLRPDLIGLDYSWRDYFIGARRLGQASLRAGYVSRAFRSETDDIWKFGIAAPVYEGNTWAGVLLVTIGTDSALGRQRLDRASEDGPMAVIVAPRDRSRTTTEGEGDYVVILHNGLTHGAGIAIDSPRLRKLGVTHTERNQLRWIDPEPITDNEHCDPVPGFGGRWLAGFAPVGDTGLVVIVQTRYDAAVEPNTRLSRSFMKRAGFVVLVWIAVSGAILWVLDRRRRRN